MFEFKQLTISGCYQIFFRIQEDLRGNFIKTFHSEFFEKQKINFNLKEEYFTYSKKNVFRGLHFQIPPKALDKLVYCVSGKVIDYLVDIRIGSPTYGKYISVELDGDAPSCIFAPIGIAHGFYVVSDDALMQYKTSEVYNKDCDVGISYLSFDFGKNWNSPVISERDNHFALLKDFNSPFIFTP